MIASQPKALLMHVAKTDLVSRVELAKVTRLGLMPLEKVQLSKTVCLNYSMGILSLNAHYGASARYGTYSSSLESGIMDKTPEPLRYYQTNIVKKMLKHYRALPDGASDDEVMRLSGEIVWPLGENRAFWALRVPLFKPDQADVARQRSDTIDAEIKYVEANGNH
ncbi:hypothetical protein WOLCODRAFT_19682 [Wolfiporia cocos MD-104 SS10]|uniref:Uncharacterized protein n=1 Tax=Wolfiporia cocos (strain MD-104) TaxID=742152 RepID=A0A2H3JE45_WOLCO|nr:hypothetical protein WOLCODRAFT_19682 [Wolfiporia cocos MD-104 SS10]